jgi:DNA-binding CsgD family transcriptional regulator
MRDYPCRSNVREHNSCSGSCSVVNAKRTQPERLCARGLPAFEALGSPLWTDRARAELARTNVAPTRDLALTPSEQRVAELAASSMTNRDVAAALFISPKTVEANLARIYRKLGINSRAERGRIIDAAE